MVGVNKLVGKVLIRSLLRHTKLGHPKSAACVIINATSIFVTTTALLCQHVIVKSICKSPAQCRQADVNQHLHNTNV